MHSTKDNKTSQSALQYDANIDKTIPCYQFFHDETVNLVRFSVPKPNSWLDTGCGTGTLILRAIQEFGILNFVAADPSEAMLQIAKDKLSGLSGLEIKYILAGTEQLYCQDRFDVVTAILAHHYLDIENRTKATKNCFHVLNEGGIYVTFETIRPNTEHGRTIGLERWRAAQMANGKTAESVDHHLQRYGIDLLPITIESHLNVLREVGFRTVELLWVSGMQAGFYGIK